MFVDWPIQQGDFLVYIGGLLPKNGHNMILKWSYSPMKQPFGVYYSRVDINMTTLPGVGRFVSTEDLVMFRVSVYVSNGIHWIQLLVFSGLQIHEWDVNILTNGIWIDGLNMFKLILLGHFSWCIAWGNARTQNLYRIL